MCGGSCYFFFQAEDGIRDYKVTGVQTCSSDLAPATTRWKSGKPNPGFPLSHRVLLCSKTERKTGGLRPPPCAAALRACRADRKSGGEGKSVELGGRRMS